MLLIWGWNQGPVNARALMVLVSYSILKLEYSGHPVECPHGNSYTIAFRSLPARVRLSRAGCFRTTRGPSQPGPTTMLLPLVVLVSLGDWPGWRGPSGMGLSDAKGLPLSWSARPASNVLWSHPLDFGAK